MGASARRTRRRRSNHEGERHSWFPALFLDAVIAPVGRSWDMPNSHTIMRLARLGILALAEGRQLPDFTPDGVRWVQLDQATADRVLGFLAPSVE